MPNILVVDGADQSCALVKSVLMGQDYGVSVSTTYEDALNKLETGLFDLVCLDTEDKSYAKFLKSAREVWADLPIIALTENPLPEIKEVFRCIPKPLSLSLFTRTVREGIEQLNTLGQKPSHRRLNLPAELSAGKENIKCRLTELSLKGAWVEPDGTPTEPFTNFFQKKVEKIIASFRKKEEEFIKIITRLAFTELSPDTQLKRAGLIFPTLTPQETQLLEGLITAAA